MHVGYNPVDDLGKIFMIRQLYKGCEDQETCILNLKQAR